jgi:hypothetical protein
MKAFSKSIEIVLLAVFLLGLSFAGSSLTQGAPAPSEYKILKTIKLGGATAERPHPRPSIVPGSFTLLIVGK